MMNEKSPKKVGKVDIFITFYVFLATYYVGIYQTIGGQYYGLDFLLGLFSYSVVGLLLGSCLELLPKKATYIVGLLAFVLLVVDTEHISVNGAHLNVSFAKFALNSSFVTVSLLNSSVALKCLYLTTLFFIAMTISRLIMFKVKYEWVLVFSLLLIIIDLNLPRIVVLPSWQQESLLISNLRRNGRVLESKMKHDRKSTWMKDLSGKSRPLKRIKRPNIVVVILEGFSQLYVEHGFAPNLAKIQKEGLVFKKFFSNQLQTNRGLFSLLCGDYPNLAHNEAKADLLNSGILKLNCLPRELRKVGYQSYFLQSAPLHFMRKDLFAKEAGYNFTVGAYSFDKNKMLSEWGVGDDTMFGAVFKLLSEKEKADRPLFISALTVGTHHPYITPVSRNKLGHAIRYTDEALGELYKLIKSNHHLKNTLFIITSDEGKNLNSELPKTYANWGLFTIVGNGIKPGQVEEHYSQVDFPLSIMDYLQKGETSSFKGRSLFRKYENERPIYLGNIYEKLILLIDGVNSYHVCNYGLNCVEVKTKNDIFDNEFEVVKGKSRRRGDIKYFVENNDLVHSSFESKILFRQEKVVIGREGVPLFSELKTGEQVHKSLKYNFTVDKKSSENRVEFIYGYYICGNPKTMVSQRSNLDNKKSNYEINLKLPESYIAKDICHESFFINKSGKEVKVENFKFSY